jgi:hypothetical protein
MSDPNVNATAESVSDKLDGEADGAQLAYRLMALLQECSIFSLRNGDGTYPYPEGPNVSSSLLDGFTTIAKIVGRTYKASDGNVYDVFDILATLLEAHLKAA